MRHHRCYVVEYESLPGQWQPVLPMVFAWCQDARRACESLRKHRPELRYRVARWVRDGLAGGRDRA